MIATYVSGLNVCKYCEIIHGAIAAHHLPDDAVVCAVKTDPETANISPKMKALLAIAGKVQQSGRAVTTVDIQRAKAEGATDREIHDTMLIAAVFCMCNRYVDGLATWAPDDPDFYRKQAALIAANGYAASTSFSTLYGFTWSAYAVAGAVGPVIMGRAFDHTGSYDRLLMKLSVLTLGTAVLSRALPRYHEPATAEVVPDLEVQVMDRG